MSRMGKLFLSLVVLVSVVVSDLATGTFEFTRKPEDAVVEKGVAHTIYCTVNPSNLRDIEYTWYKFNSFSDWKDVVFGNKDDVIVSEYKSSQMIILEADVSDSGYYMCKVSTNKYTLFSDTAHITIVYFDAPATKTRNEEIPRNEKLTYVQCDVPDSNTPTKIRWYKVNGDEETEVQNERMFVIQIADGQIQKGNRGSLAIINAQNSDAGLYKCTTFHKQRYVLTEVTIKIISGSSSSGIDPNFFLVSNRAASAVKGSTVSLYCAIYGEPLKTVIWWFVKGETEIEIKTTDTISLKDNNRHLELTNVQDKNDGKYDCRIPNSLNEASIVLDVVEKKVELIEVLKSPTSFILKPNLYEPNELDCVAKDSGSITLRFLKNSKRRSDSSRIIVDNTPENGTVQLNLVMDQPNESDLGVYQCLLSTDTHLIERTAYITLEKESIPFARAKKPEYLYVNQLKKVDKAEEYCRKVFKEGVGHLVSIMSEDENQKVQELVNRQKDPSVNTFWIGLTREVPTPKGLWKWVQPGDPSAVYSNWEDGKPYDLGNQEYAVMNSDTGKWIDVTNREERTFVCKRYVTVCPSVDMFFKGRLRVRGWETIDTNYDVGEQVKVYCSDVVTKIDFKEVECQPDGTFTPVPKDIECPEISSAAAFLINSLLVVSVVMARLMS